MITALAWFFMNAGDLVPPWVTDCKAARGLGWRLILCPLATLLLCSCATPYKPVNHRYGYSEQQVGNDVYEVSFLANGHTSYERALDFAMLRASEIALNHQAKSFVILDLVNLSSARSYHTDTHPYRTASLYMSPADQTILPPGGPVGWTTWSYQALEAPQERIYYRPGVKLKIKLLSDPPGTYYPYDPAKESERLEYKYHIKPAIQANPLL